MIKLRNGTKILVEEPNLNSLKSLEKRSETKSRKLYAALISKLGADHQRSVAMGELGELINALSKHLRGKGVNMKTCEEIADVEIVLEQLKIMHDPEGIRVPLFKRFKLARLAEFNVKGGET